MTELILYKHCLCSILASFEKKKTKHFPDTMTLYYKHIMTRVEVIACEQRNINGIEQ